MQIGGVHRRPDGVDRQRTDGTTSRRDFLDHDKSATSIDARQFEQIELTTLGRAALPGH